MKRVWMLVIAFLLIISGCTVNQETAYATFSGTVSSLAGHTMTIAVAEGDILRSTDCVIALFPNTMELTVAAGDTVQIWYDGTVMESDPAQVNAVRYEVLQHAQTTASASDSADASETERADAIEDDVPTASALPDTVQLSPDTPTAFHLSSGTSEVQVDLAETGGNVRITLRLNDTTIEIGEFGRLGDAYLLHLSDDRWFVLLDADYASDDYVTFLFEVTDGEPVQKSRLEDVSLQSATVDAAYLNLRVHVDVFGSYDASMNYEIDASGALQATDSIFEIETDQNEWRLITVKKEVPVTIGGNATTLPVGTQIRITGTDNQSTAYFRIENTGEEGSITYVRGDGAEDTYTLFIDGCSEYDYFDMLPYAG